jgi:uncharacterized membrane-anchored protein
MASSMTPSPSSTKSKAYILDFGQSIDLVHAVQRKQNMSTATFDTPQSVFNRVPKVTIDFWLIKLMAVTMGETAADYLAVNLGLGLTSTAVFMSVVLGVALYLQFAQKKYVPAYYWAAVVLISVVGTLITDCLIDIVGVPLTTTTTVFTVLLALTFALWYFSEKTLSIHTIFSTKRETFYWLTILFTFALGTAAGDLVAEQYDIGYLNTGLVFCAIIAAFYVGYAILKLNAILMFWLAYIFTRPLGASFGDLLSQPKDYGGMGFGTVITSALFLAAIIALVVFMTVTHDGDQEQSSTTAV